MSTGDHLLHCVIDGQHGDVSWNLTCHHVLGAYPTYDLEDEAEPPSPECWVPDWWDDVGMDAVSGAWPEQIVFPCPVRCEWADGLAIYYEVET